MSIKDLIHKYQKPGGRYVYYPPLSRWKEAKEQENTLWKTLVSKSLAEEKVFDLYFHIPFCKKICTFCGCNIKVTNNQSEEEVFTANLLKEFVDLTENKKLNISSLTLGGGSPNYLSPKVIRDLLEKIKENIQLQENPILKLEIDPRYINEEWVEAIAILPWNTFSLGIQDFNEKIVSNVNRSQSLEQINQCIKLIKKYFSKPHINIDLIYGLPLQSRETIKQWEPILRELRPDGISLYPLAPVPWLKKTQEAMGEVQQFSSSELADLHYTAHQQMENLGFKAIGFGHYLNNNQFENYRRTLMGYFTGNSDGLLGFGPSAISFLGEYRKQNWKILDRYYAGISLDTTSEKYHQQSEKEQYMEKLFLDLATKGSASIKHNLDLQKFISDGLIKFESGELNINPQGRLFLKQLFQEIETQL